MARRRRRRGLSLVETAIGFIVLIPIGLLAIDLITLFSCSQNNEQYAEMAARAAATRGNQQSAQKAAEQAILADFEATPVIESLNIGDVDFDVGAGHVSVVTTMDVKLPVPFPGFSQVTCNACSIQPIVAFPAPR